MWNHIKQWFTLHTSILFTALYFFAPPVQRWIFSHPKTVAASILSTVFSALLQKSPLQPKEL